MKVKAGDYMAKSYKITLNDGQLEFLQKLAKYDGMSVQAEVQALLDLQINETQDTMKEFWGKDNDGE